MFNFKISLQIKKQNKTPILYFFLAWNTHPLHTAATILDIF